VFSKISEVELTTDHWSADVILDIILDVIAFRSTFLKWHNFPERTLVTDSTDKHCWQDAVFWKVCKVRLAKMLPLHAFRQAKICKGSDAVTDICIPVWLCTINLFFALCCQPLLQTVLCKVIMWTFWKSVFLHILLFLMFFVWL